MVSHNTFPQVSAWNSSRQMVKRKTTRFRSLQLTFFSARSQKTYNVRPPRYLSWFITPKTMVYGTCTYNYSYWGESKPTNITGGPHIAGFPTDFSTRSPDVPDHRNRSGEHPLLRPELGGPSWTWLGLCLDIRGGLHVRQRTHTGYHRDNSWLIHVQLLLTSWSTNWDMNLNKNMLKII